MPDTRTAIATPWRRKKTRKRMPEGEQQQKLRAASSSSSSSSSVRTMDCGSDRRKATTAVLRLATLLRGNGGGGRLALLFAAAAVRGTTTAREPLAAPPAAALAFAFPSRGYGRASRPGTSPPARGRRGLRTSETSAASARAPSPASVVPSATPSPPSLLPPSSFVRWRRRPAQNRASDEGRAGDPSSLWELQTSVTTYRRRAASDCDSPRNATAAAAAATTIDLHSVVHLGESSYYESINRDLLLCGGYDAVVYELLVDEGLLRPIGLGHDQSGEPAIERPSADRSPALRELAGPVGASDRDRAAARSYGLACQSDLVRYCGGALADGPPGPRLVHGDWTWQELARHEEEKGQRAQESRQPNIESEGWTSSPLLSLLSRVQRQLGHRQAPLEPPAPWQQQQSGGWSAAREAATALWAGPPLLLAQRRRQQESSGRGPPIAPSFQRFLRSIVWLTVPSPEVSILLLDWSALLRIGAAAPDVSDDGDGEGARRQRTRNGDVALETVFPSPASRAVLAALACGDWNAARKLVFGQILYVAATTTTAFSSTTAAAAAADSPGPSDWMSLRNERAVRVADRVIGERQRQGHESTSVAILYGCLHCPDLHDRVVSMGYDPVPGRGWRTAWTVRVPDFSAAATTSRLLDRSVLQLLAVLVLYLGLGGIDWLATVGDATRAASDMVRAASAAASTPELPGALGSAADAGPAAVLRAPLSVAQDYALYLARHLLLYLGLSKFVWSTRDRSEGATYKDVQQNLH